MKTSFHNTLKSFRQIFKRPPYVVVMFGVAAAIFLTGIFIINHEFIRFVYASDLFTGADRWSLISSSVGSFMTAIPFSSQFFLIVVAVLAGVNVSYFVYYMRRRIQKQRSAGIGILGIVGGMFGVGCGACGSVLLSSVIGLGATSQVVGFLPLNGIEFSLLSVLILVASTMFLGNKIQDPAVCPVKLPKK